MSRREELDEGVKTRRVERSVRAHLQQVHRTEGREDSMQLGLTHTHTQYQAAAQIEHRLQDGV